MDVGGAVLSALDDTLNTTTHELTSAGKDISQTSIAIMRALALADVRQRLDALGFEPVGSTPEETTAFLRSELARWGKVIRERGITLE